MRYWLLFLLLPCLEVGAAQRNQVTLETWLRESAKAEGLRMFIQADPAMQQRARARGGLEQALQALPKGWAYQRQGTVVLVARAAHLPAYRTFVYSRYPKLRQTVAKNNGYSTHTQARYLHLKGSQVLQEEKRALPASAIRLEAAVYGRGQAWNLELSPLGPACIRLRSLYCLYNPNIGDQGHITLEGRTLNYRVATREHLVHMVWLR